MPLVGSATPHLSSTPALTLTFENQTSRILLICLMKNVEGNAGKGIRKATKSAYGEEVFLQHFLTGTAACVTLSLSLSPSLSNSHLCIFRTKIDDDVGIFVENFKARLQIRVVFFMENVLKFVFVDILICKPIECVCVGVCKCVSI